jgi:hypothetical protein
MQNFVHSFDVSQYKHAAHVDRNITTTQQFSRIAQIRDQA